MAPFTSDIDHLVLGLLSQTPTTNNLSVAALCSSLSSGGAEHGPLRLNVAGLP